MTTDTLRNLAEAFGLSRDELRTAIATYLLGQMMSTKMENKEAKVKAAYEYADLILKG